MTTPKERTNGKVNGKQREKIIELGVRATSSKNEGGLIGLLQRRVIIATSDSTYHAYFRYSPQTGEIARFSDHNFPGFSKDENGLAQGSLNAKTYMGKSHLVLNYDLGNLKYQATPEAKEVIAEIFRRYNNLVISPESDLDPRRLGKPMNQLGRAFLRILGFN